MGSPPTGPDRAPPSSTETGVAHVHLSLRTPPAEPPSPGGDTSGIGTRSDMRTPYRRRTPGRVGGTGANG